MNILLSYSATTRAVGTATSIRYISHPENYIISKYTKQNKSVYSFELCV